MNIKAESTQTLFIPSGEPEWEPLQTRRNLNLTRRRENDKIIIQPETAQELHEAESFYNMLADDTRLDTPWQDLKPGTLAKASVVFTGFDSVVLQPVSSKIPVFVRRDAETDEFAELSPNSIVTVYISHVERRGGTPIQATGNFRLVSREQTRARIQHAIDNAEQRAFKGVVEEQYPTGFRVNIDGVDCFMPGSEANISRGFDLDSLAGTTVEVVPVSQGSGHTLPIVSRKQNQIQQQRQALAEIAADLGEKRYGVVAGVTAFGVFVNFCQDLVSGLIHKSEMEPEFFKRWNTGKVVKGEDVDFWVKEIVHADRIILTQKQTSVDPWDLFSPPKTLPQDVKARVVGVKDFGVFLEMPSGVVGLLHTSKMNGIHPRVFNRQKYMNVKLTDIDYKNKKLFFSM